MKNTRLLLASGSIGLTCMFAQSAYAAGTTAGTLIQNTATATYSSGTTNASVQSNTVTVKVDELINVAVTSLTATAVPAGASAAVLTYQVTNTGNGTQAFNLTADPAVSGNVFNTATQSVAIDTNGNGVYDPGVDTIITNGAAGPAIAPDGSIKVFVLSNAPTTATDAQTSQVRLTAASTTGTGPAGTLLAGKGVGGVDAVIGASTGTANALATVIASLANITLTKSAVIADPFGGTTPVPGSTVTYSLLLHVTGSGTANAVHITDAYPTGTTYQSGTLTLNGAVLTDAADTDTGTASATGIDVSLGSVAGGSADKTVSFKVKIN
jgi:uncharacterized repeat protein (TIGR01451 family)